MNRRQRGYDAVGVYLYGHAGNGDGGYSVTVHFDPMPIRTVSFTPMKPALDGYIPHFEWGDKEFRVDKAAGAYQQIFGEVTGGSVFAQEINP